MDSKQTYFTQEMKKSLTIAILFICWTVAFTGLGFAKGQLKIYKKMYEGDSYDVPVHLDVQVPHEVNEEVLIEPQEKKSKKW